MDILVIIIRSARRFSTIMVFPSIFGSIACSDLFHDSFSFIDEVDTNIIYAKIKK